MEMVVVAVKRGGDCKSDAELMIGIIKRMGGRGLGGMIIIIKLI